MTHKTYEQNIRNNSIVNHTVPSQNSKHAVYYSNNQGMSQYDITMTSYGRHGVSNHRQILCSFNRLPRITSKKTSKIRVTGPLWGELRCPMDSPHNRRVTWKKFHVMTYSWPMGVTDTIPPGILSPWNTSGYVMILFVAQRVNRTYIQLHRFLEIPTLGISRV